MKNIPKMLWSFWLFILTVVAQACPTPTNLAYDGQARTEIVYAGTSVPAPDYDSAPMLPASETRNPTARTSDAFVDFPEFLAAEGTALGAENAVNGVRLNQQLTAQSMFTPSGELSQQAISEAEEIIPAAKLNNPAIPQGFSKYSIDSFTPSGPGQVHFYMNPTTGEINYGLDYKFIPQQFIGK